MDPENSLGRLRWYNVGMGLLHGDPGDRRCSPLQRLRAARDGHVHRPWQSYLFGEYVYVALSLVAKSALAWQVFANTLVPG